MKHLKRLAAGFGVILLSASPLLLGGVANAAGTVNLSLSPATANLNIGDSLAVDVVEDSGTNPVFTVQANLTYSSSILSYTNYANSAAFGTESQTNVGAGVAQLGRGVTCNGGCPAVTGQQTVVTLYFTAIANGTATISFSNDSTAKYIAPGDPNPNDIVVYSINPASGSYQVGPVSTPPSGGSGGGSTGSGSGGSSSSSGSSGSSKNTSSSTTASKPPASSGAAPTASVSDTAFGGTSLTLSDIKVSDLSNYSATIQWQSSVAATSQVSYGVAADQLFYTNSDNNMAVNHSLKLSKTNLLAGQTYYYKVKSVDANGNVASSTVQSFKTLGGAATTTSKNSSTGTMVGIVAVVLLGLAVVFAMLRLRKMHHDHNELDKHFLNGDPMQGPKAGTGTGAAPGSSSSATVVTPQGKNPPPTS